IAEIAVRLDLPPGPAAISRFGQGGAQWLAGVAAGDAVDLVFAERPDKGAAAEIARVMPLLVGPSDNLYPEPGAIGIGGEGASEFEPVDDTKRAVEQPPAGASVIANDIADAVNRGVKTCGPELLGKPVARGDILGGIGRAVDAGLVPPEFRQPPEVGDHALTIDARHIWALPLGVAATGRSWRPARLNMISAIRAPARRCATGSIAGSPVRCARSGSRENSVRHGIRGRSPCRHGS